MMYHTGTITDITKTNRQVKKILNLIFRKIFEPAGTLIEEWIFLARTPGVGHNISSHKNPCDIHLKHVFLAKFGLWRTPAPKSRLISFRFFGYHNLGRTVAILNISRLADIWFLTGDICKTRLKS